MNSNVLNCSPLFAVILGAVGCSSTQTASTPPRTVIIEQQAPRPTEPPKTYDYTQKVETSKTLFNADKSRHFVSEFGALFAGKGKPAPTFAIRVNPMPDGSRTTPSQFDDAQGRAELVRYFGRPLREGGIKLVDEATSPASKIDIALNLLISWQTLQITGFSGEAVNKVVPEVQVTAIRVVDGAIIGQAGTVDLIGQRQDSWVTVERVGVPEVMRATALVLLEDMVTHKLNEEVAALTQEKGKMVATLPVPSVATEPVKGVEDATPKRPPSQPVSTAITPPSPRPAIAQIDLSVIALVDDAKVKDEATRLNNQIANLNKKSQEIEIWKIALVGDDQAGKVPDKNSVELVKNYVKQNYQPQ